MPIELTGQSEFEVVARPVGRNRCRASKHQAFIDAVKATLDEAGTAVRVPLNGRKANSLRAARWVVLMRKVDAASVIARCRADGDGILFWLEKRGDSR